MAAAISPSADPKLAERPTLEASIAAAVEARAAASAENSRIAFASDMRNLQGWLEFARFTWTDGEALPVPVLAAYLGSLLASGAALSTIKRRIASIAKQHREHNLPSPTVANEIRELLAGASRGARPPAKKSAATPAMIRAAICDSSFSLRDKALLAVGFVTGMRRSELVALRWTDLTDDARGGYVATIPKSKTGARLVAIPGTGDPVYCPATLLRRLKAVSAEDRPFPICDKTVDNTVKRAASLSGYDPRDFGAHSLRAGMITLAANDGVSLGEIMGASGHRSAQAAAGYMRPSEQGRNPAHHAAAKALAR